MKITQLDLASFRSFVGTKINTDSPRVYFGGPNGVGKTTIREAIKWALTGKCDVTDARGAGAEELIPIAQAAAHVGVTIEGLGEVGRTISPSGSAFSVDGFSGTSQVQQGALYGKLNANPAFLDAVLDTEVFTRLHHGDAKGLVLTLLDVRVPWGDQELTLDQVEALYKTAFEDRKAAKRAAQGFYRPPSPAVQEFPPEEAIQKQLDKLRSERSEAEKDIGATIGTRKALQDELNRLDVSMPTQDPTLDDRIAEVEQTLAGIEEPPPPERQITKPSNKGDAVQVVFYRQKIDALRKHDPKQGCVIDGNVPCKTAKSNFGSRADFLQADVDRIVFEQGEPNAPSLSASELRRQLAALRDQVSRHEAKKQTAQTNMLRAEEIQAQLAALPTTATQEETITLFDKRIAKGEQLLKDRAAYQTAVELHRNGAIEAKKLEDEVERLEKVCEDLGPNGIRAKALGEAVGAFETLIDQHLQAWQYAVSFEVEPWKVVVNGRDFRTYSKSERWRIGMAIQLAIAQVSGLKFAVLDEIDMLDLDVRKAVLDLVLDNTPDLEQVFMMSTREPEKPLPTGEVGLKSFRLGKQDGRSVVVEEA